MELNTDSLRKSQNGMYLLFRNGIAFDIFEVENADMTISKFGARYKNAYPDVIEKQFGRANYTFFSLSEIKMPCQKTAQIQEALNEIEPKSKRCEDWIRDMEEGALKTAVKAEMDAFIAHERKAVNLHDAIEQAVFFDENQNCEYIREELKKLKNQL